MLFEFRLPDLGEGIREAEVLSIEISPGQMIQENESILKVETDKAAVEIPSPVSGQVKDVRVKAGEIVTVGSIMVTFITDDASNASFEHHLGAPALEGGKAQGAPGNNDQRQENAEDILSPAATPENARNDRTSYGSKVPTRATPATRRLARELGVDLRLVQASDRLGRISKEDVRSFAAKSLEPMVSDPLAQPNSIRANGQATGAGVDPDLKDLSAKYGGEEEQQTRVAPLALTGESAIALPDFSKFGKVEHVPLRSIRRKTAEGMALSWAHIPHVTHCDEADLTALDELRIKYDGTVKESGGRLTFTVFVLKAVVHALKRYPQFNASLDEAKSEIVFKHFYNIGVAVATERGLIVPVIREVEQKGIVELAVELAQIAERTRQGKIALDNLQGGTFTITNVGAIGGTSMSPMINYPEAAILGMAKARQIPVVRNGKIEIGLILPLALSFDHRIADGAEAAHFMRHIIGLLEEPFKFLLEA